MCPGCSSRKIGIIYFPYKKLLDNGIRERDALDLLKVTDMCCRMQLWRTPQTLLPKSFLPTATGVAPTEMEALPMDGDDVMDDLVESIGLLSTNDTTRGIGRPSSSQVPRALLNADMHAAKRLEVHGAQPPPDLRTHGTERDFIARMRFVEAAEDIFDKYALGTISETQMREYAELEVGRSAVPHVWRRILELVDKFSITKNFSAEELALLRSGDTRAPGYANVANKQKTFRQQRAIEAELVKRALRDAADEERRAALEVLGLLGPAEGEEKRGVVTVRRTVRFGEAGRQPPPIPVTPQEERRKPEEHRIAEPVPQMPSRPPVMVKRVPKATVRRYEQLY